MFLSIAENFSFYLPVYLPFIFALLSIIAGIASSKINLTFNDLLKVHGDMTLGLFSFVTWAIVTYMQTGVVALNSNYFIEFSHILFLLLINFALLLFSIIAIRHSWKTGKINEFIKWQPEALERFVNFLVLMVSIFCAFLPLMLIKPVIKPAAPENGFTVIVPYQDYSLINHVGSTRWGSRMLCDIEQINAIDEVTAVREVLERFKKSPSNQIAIPLSKKKTDSAEAGSISIYDNQIIVKKAKAITN
ncbi:hypothetical protein A7981_08455 [Methylovorus sp. MM2]|uniref:hypothetical protein n=1 Tax=Methylovorus sp. MM2 TaxID=1848038 RepID=UPI0007E1EB87|nr:hypothetical protein [Methylovorus sp. MM2]OAM51512.1 hypothetical protein A7981_08455 [Methylovorus sp. MM2]